MSTPRNLHRNYRNAHQEQAAVDTDGNGDVTITVSELRSIPSVAHVTAGASGGFVASVQSVSGNQVTVRIFQDAGAAGELAAVTNTADATDVHINATGR